MKDKALIDESIESVNVVYPDQYGRLTGLKLNAEYFLDQIEGAGRDMFEVKQNPFRYDALGKAIDFPEGMKLPKSLLLKPELSTMRECSWQKREALVMADVHNPDEEGTPVLSYSPRHILKEVVKANPHPDLTTQLLFSFVL